MSYKQAEYNMIILAKTMCKGWFWNPKEGHVIEQEEVLLWEIVVVYLVKEEWLEEHGVHTEKSSRS